MTPRLGALTAAMVDHALPISGDDTIKEHVAAHVALSDRIKREEAVGGTDNE